MSDIQPEDSASNVGSSTSTSSASKLAALKVKLEYAQKRARLQEERVLQQARLQEQQTLQRVRTENELEILSAEEEVAVAEAEILAEEEQSAKGSRVRSNVSRYLSPSAHDHGGVLTSSPPKTNGAALISPPPRDNGGAPTSPPPQDYGEHSSFNTDRDIINNMPPLANRGPVRSVRSVSPVRQPNARFNSRSQVHLSRPRTSIALPRPEPSPHVSPVHDPSDAAWHSAADSVPQQVDFNTSGLAEVLENINKSSKQARLPSASIPVFDGDPRSFQRFITTFQFAIEKNTDDAGSRLNLLVEYTSGAARSIIEDCVLYGPEQGYPMALDLLKQNFGKPYNIAQSHIKGLVSGKRIPADDPEALLNFSRELLKANNSLEALGYTADLNATTNIKAVARRLPFHVQTRWADRAQALQKSSIEPKFKDLVELVQDRADAACSAYAPEPKAPDKVQSSKTREKPKRSAFATQAEGAANDKPPKPCPVCGELHSIMKCQLFVKKSLRERASLAQDKQLCYNCLGPHRKADCKSKFRCRECKGRHHTLLHDDASKPQEPTKADQLASNEQPSMVSSTMRGQVYLRILPVKVSAGNKTVSTLAMMDDGSQTTLCTSSLLKRLQAKTKPCSVDIVTIMGQSNTIQSKQADLTIKSMDGRSAFDIKEVRALDTLPISIDAAAHLDNEGDLCHLNDIIQGIRQQCSSNKLKPDHPVEILLGLDTPGIFWVEEERRGPVNLPFAQRTKLGWTIQGPASNRPKTRVAVNFCQERIEDQLERMWKADFPDAESHHGDKTVPSLNDKQAAKLVEASIVRKDNRFIVGMPWKTPKEKIPNNRVVAERRLHSLKRKLECDPDLHSKYIAAVNDYLDNGYAEKVEDELLTQARLISPPQLTQARLISPSQLSQAGHISPPPLSQARLISPSQLSQAGHISPPPLSQARLTSPPQLTQAGLNSQPLSVNGCRSSASHGLWYIPHHAVVNPNKEKIRVVFDCAATFKGRSLNDHLYQGPDLINSLIGMLIRFRMHPVALVADIKAMFPQIKVLPGDKDLLRFLWFPNGDLKKPPQAYCMTRHVFGATSSPFVAAFSLWAAATLAPNDVTKRTIEDSFYVDDLLTSCNTKDEAVDLAHDLISTLAKSGFSLMKFISNKQEVMEALPHERLAPSVKDVDVCLDSPIERTLGLRWMVGEDRYTFRVNLPSKPSTRRGVLSTASSLYDPIGFVAPVTLLPKWILQMNAGGWDDEIEAKSLSRWENWKESLKQLEELRIPRWYRTSTDTATSVELHVFSDASESAYGAVIYLRHVTRANIDVAFVLGKSRVAPKKTVSIPRLELSAASTACKLAAIAADELKVPHSAITYWTDSMAVIRFINNRDTRFKVFVANRLAVIHEHSQPSQWSYVNTKENPADVASRGAAPDDTDLLQFWLHGPSFLREAEIKHSQPNHSVHDIAPEEQTEIKTVTITQEGSSVIGRLVSRWSDYNKLIRRVAHLMRFAMRGYFKKVKEEKPAFKPIDAGEFFAAEVRVIKDVQTQAFGSEIKRLQKGQAVRSSSRLLQLTPALDKDGLLRVGGRIRNSKETAASKHPIVIPRGTFSRLLLEKLHKENGHVGCNHLIAIARQNFWIIKGLSLAKQVARTCMECRKRFAKPCSQLMADLPAERLEADKPPFTNTGVDYFGPLEVKLGRSRVKRYGVIFTCLVSRAVHLEVAHSLTTDSFLGVLSRFIARRGKPSVIFSDNGTNLVGAEKELRKMLTSLNQERIGAALAPQQIQWKFLPPHASHMAGAWERLIQSTKRILQSLINQQTLTDETLLTLMAEAERIMNSRPLVAGDPGSPPLTPAHLLQCRNDSSSLPQGVFDEKDTYARRWWRQAQYLADVFWRRWTKGVPPAPPNPL